MEDYDHCYECCGYGDDYYYDAEQDELVSACETCIFNPYANRVNDAETHRTPPERAERPVATF